MSFDVFFHGFEHGHARDSGGAAARDVLTPYIRAEERAVHYLEIAVADGSADVYLSAGDPGTMLAHHVAGDEPWDVLVAAAREADWVILVDGRTALTAPDQWQHLPPELSDDPVLVLNGQELLELVRTL